VCVDGEKPPKKNFRIKIFVLENKSLKIWTFLVDFFFEIPIID